MFRLAVLLLLALVVAVGAAACGGGEDAAPTAETVETGAGTDTDDDGTETETEPETEPGGATGDPANGKEIFMAQGCGSCHTLADAGTSGTIGPNLDEAQPNSETVVDRVTNGSGAMPSFKDQLSEEEINDVAAYVVEATSD
jgi:mono/diheme cytochrome c family protein